MKKEKIFLSLIVAACFLILLYLFIGAVSNIRTVETKTLEASRTVAPKPTFAPYLGTINPLEADAETLDLLPGVGPSTAQAFEDYLSQPGNTFYFPEDITNVKGIGAKKLQDILPYITLPTPPMPSESPLF